MPKPASPATTPPCSRSMTRNKGRKRRQRAPWLEPLLDELSDESEDERVDFARPDRNPFEHEHGPEMGHDGDENMTYAKHKPKFDTDKLEKGNIQDPVRVKLDPADNLPGQMVDAGHGFIVNDPRSRPWKTAPRTRCANCGGPLPGPDVCELDPHASEIELAFVGDDNGRDDRGWWSPPPSLVPGCQCGNCTLRYFVKRGWERGTGRPRKYCSPKCSKEFTSQREKFKRGTAPKPEDLGLRFRPARGLRSSAEGTHRYVSSRGLPWGAPRA
jgi:hypothetical protein